MKRTPLPSRKVALARAATPLTTTTPLRRTDLRRSPLRRAKPMRAPEQGQERPGGQGWTPETRAVVSSRSGGRCEIGLPGCAGDATDLHHRKRRREGDHRAVNAAHACRGCHSWVHGHPAAAKDRGWIVRPWLDPVSEPMWVRGRLCWLTVQGGCVAGAVS